MRHSLYFFSTEGVDMATKGTLVEAKARPHSRGKKRLRDINVREAESGGHVVMHHFKDDGPMPAYHEPEEHIFGTDEGGKLLDHLITHLHIKHSDKESSED
jgi:hypothetical protein